MRSASPMPTHRKRQERDEWGTEGPCRFKREAGPSAALAQSAHQLRSGRQISGWLWRNSNSNSNRDGIFNLNRNRDGNCNLIRSRKGNYSRSRNGNRNRNSEFGSLEFFSYELGVVRGSRGL